MNLREYLFYTKKSLADFAAECKVARPYLTSLLNGKYPLCDKMALRIEKTTNGAVLSNEIFADDNHPDLKKII